MTPVFGCEEAYAAFADGLRSGRLHHAWLLAGPMGVGKSSFAKAVAPRLLARDLDLDGFDLPADHQAARLFAAESHPDFRLVEREVWDKSNNIVPKHERTGTEEPVRNIRVKQVRMLDSLMTMSPAMGGRRVIIIDAADDLERGAANALLKMLEEPPPDTIFLLISHAPERLIPTIRSRCRLLRMQPLAPDAMTSALRAALPDADSEEIEALAAVGEGAPGRAIAWRGLDIAALDRELDALVRQGDRTNGRRSALAGSLSLKAAQGRYEAFLARAPSRIAAAAKDRTGRARADAIRLWERAAALAGSARRHSLDPHSVVFELAGMLAALAEEEGRHAA
jgi:DNA polymerase-3 subunit delta'